jgi:HEAT repeat protein
LRSSIEALDALQEIVRDPDALVRRRAHEAIQQIRPEPVQPAADGPEEG